MSVKSLPIVKFASKGQDSFYDTIKQRVNDYFQSQNISRYSNSTMYIKTVAMLAMYFVPYAFIVAGAGEVSLGLFYFLWIVMGFGISGIGTSVMHDANHGAYSTNQFMNTTLGNVLNLLGGYARNWKIQHNILHHTYTNVHGLDEDIDAGILLRMSPNSEHRGFHRYQHIYAWVLYGIMNIFWVTVKDYKAIFKYSKNGMLGKQRITLTKAVLELTGLKLLYAAYILAIPIVFGGVAWYHVVLGFVAMHMVAGLLLACIFQLAHVMGSSDYSMPAENRKMENSWAIHQLQNTTNFAPKNLLLSWYIGGLNYQIEHHLFPHICHVHYPEISRIVENTAREYNLPYNVQPTFRKALREHGRMLKELGKAV